MRSPSSPGCGPPSPPPSPATPPPPTAPPPTPRAATVVNPDVLHALLTLDHDVPETVRWACNDISEHWVHRDLSGCLHQLPRMAGRMHDLGHVAAVKDLTWQADGWLRMVKRALGLRRPTCPSATDCPYAETRPDTHAAPRPLIRQAPKGSSARLVTACGEWVTSGLIYCASADCGASWMKTEWSMLDRLLQASARDAA